MYCLLRSKWPNAFVKKTLITYSPPGERVSSNILLLVVRKRLGETLPNPVHAHQMY